MRRSSTALLAVVTFLGVATTGLQAAPADASAVPGGTTRATTSTTAASSAASRNGRAAPSHQNPVALSLPDGQTAASCADPTVIHGAGRDRNWYLYCTTDALTATEQNPDGSSCSTPCRRTGRPT